VLWLCSTASSASFGGPLHLAAPARRLPNACMLAKQRKAGAKRKGGPTKISTKGFGAALVPAPRGVAPGKILTDPAYDALSEWLTAQGANLQRVAIADFGGLRGVMATQELAAGDEIISIPGKCAVDLGSQGEDPIPAALQLLQALHSDAERGRRTAYWELLPPPYSPDLCTPDFFSEKELQMLQWPPLVREVRHRSAQLRKILGDRAPTGDTDVEELAVAGGRLRELRWATWLVLSRVLTVRGPDAKGHKLLIPFIDMFNHRSSSRHYLTGRTDGALRVVAGARVAAGEQIFIVYGTEATSNAELLGHYGFVDPSAHVADRRLLEAHPEAQAALSMSTMEEDEELLRAEGLPAHEQLALRFRLSLKQTLEE